MPVETLEPSRHKCLIYDGDPADQLPVIVPLILEGLELNNRCLYLGDPLMLQMLDTALEDRGVDTHRELKRGALMYSSDRSHLADGGFDPQLLVEKLSDMVDESIKDGFSGLTATGDMRYELGDDLNFDKLLHYEALLEEVFKTKALRGICQYHRATVPHRAIQDALVTHRSLYIGMTLNADNIFYMPPALLLKERSHRTRDEQAEWMFQQISRVMDAERKRDAALKEQVRLSRELEEANRTLEEKVKERTAELEKINKELEAFSYSVSHDLRAPLRHIEGFIAILKKRLKTIEPEAQKAMDTISGAAQTMATLIEALLAFSRLDRAELQKCRMDLGLLFEEVRRSLEPDYRGRKITWKIGPLPKAECDAQLMRQVFSNLIQNAVKFTRTKPEALIEVSSSSTPAEHTICIRDNGVGFEPTHASKLFGVFQRLHTQEEFEGTGIGLANIQRIIHRHGGRVWAEGEVGKGAVFCFTLPAGATV